MAESGKHEVAVIGLVWYRRADYPRIREIMRDSGRLPPTFDKWQGQAERHEADLRRAGRTTVRAHVDPEQFLAWCAGTGRQVDAKARIDWANLVALRHVRGEH